LREVVLGDLENALALAADPHMEILQTFAVSAVGRSFIQECECRRNELKAFVNIRSGVVDACKQIFDSTATDTVDTAITEANVTSLSMEVVIVMTERMNRVNAAAHKVKHDSKDQEVLACAEKMNHYCCEMSFVALKAASSLFLQCAGKSISLPDMVKGLTSVRSALALFLAPKQLLALLSDVCLTPGSPGDIPVVRKKFDHAMIAAVIGSWIRFLVLPIYLAVKV
jgi:hypothetical protein